MALLPISLHKELLVFNKINWNEVGLLYNKGWISKKELLDYCCYKIQEGTLLEKKIIEILISNDDFEIKEKLYHLASKEKEPLNSNKMVRSFLCYFLELEAPLEDVLDTLEDIYYELGYPNDLACFIRYMPIEKEDPIILDSIENFQKKIKRKLEGWAEWETYWEKREAKQAKKKK